jgi:hypothetical protein
MMTADPKHRRICSSSAKAGSISRDAGTPGIRLERPFADGCVSGLSLKDMAAPPFISHAMRVAVRPVRAPTRKTSGRGRGRRLTSQPRPVPGANILGDAGGALNVSKLVTIAEWCLYKIAHFGRVAIRLPTRSKQGHPSIWFLHFTTIVRRPPSGQFYTDWRHERAHAARTLRRTSPRSRPHAAQLACALRCPADRVATRGPVLVQALVRPQGAVTLRPQLKIVQCRMARTIVISEGFVTP